jgi:DNA-binding NarL/FixJ family response regulator
MLEDKFSRTPYGQLPPTIRALNIAVDGAKTTDWLQQCLSDDSAMDVALSAGTLESAMTSLREEFFDVVILHDHVQLDALSALEPLRTASPDHLAIVVIGTYPAEEKTAIYLDAGADGYVCRQKTNVRTLLWTLARAAERQRLLREAAASQQTLELQRSQHHQDAIHQLRIQRGMLLEHSSVQNAESMESDSTGTGSTGTGSASQSESAGFELSVSDPNPPAWLVDYFQDLLKMYVVSGSGNHSAEVGQLVDRLEHCEVTLAEALTAHTLSAEQLVLSLGNRPAWHILGRANLLALELVMQWHPASELRRTS